MTAATATAAGDSRPAPPPPGRTGAMRRGLKLLLEILAALVAGLAVLAALIAWRLSLGPITLDFLTPAIEEALNSPDGRMRIDIEDTVLTWDSAGQSLDVRARQVRAYGESAVPIASVPELGISFSLPALVRGRLAPTRLTLVRPQLRVIRTVDGDFMIDIRAEGEDVERADDLDVGAAMLEALRRPPDPLSPFGALVELRVTGAELMVDNRELGVAWRAPRADIDLRRDHAGIRGRVRLDVAQGERVAVVEADLRHDAADGTTEADLRFRDLWPVGLAELAPELAPLAGADLTITGTAQVHLDRSFQPDRARFAVETGAGTLAMPAVLPAPLAITGAAVRGAADLPARRLAIDDFRAKAAHPGIPGGHLTLTGGGTASLDAEGVRASSRLALTIGDHETTNHETAVQAELAYRTDDGSVVVGARVAGLEPARLAGLAPALAPLAAVALPLAGTVTVALGPGFVLEAGRIELNGGAGILTLPTLYPEPLALKALALRAAVEGDHGTERLTVEELSADLGGPVLGVQASATRGADGIAVSAQAMVKHMPMDDLHRYWPAAVGTNARAWIVENLSAGHAGRAWIKLAAKAPSADPAGLTLDTLDGGLEFEGVTVEYFRPLPPVTGVSGAATTDGKTFALKLNGGHLQDLMVGASTIDITGLDNDQEHIAIDVVVQGPARTVLSVLDSPPLGYARRFDLDPRKAGGLASARLRFDFPLVVDLDIDNVGIGAAANLRGIAVPDAVPGVNATDGNLTLALDGTGMTLKGTAKLNGAAAAIEWRESFSAAVPGPRTRLAVTGAFDEADRGRLGVDVVPYLLGPAATDAVLTIDRNKRMGATVKLDLAKATLALPDLDWTKPAGTPGTARFNVEFRNGKLLGLRDIAIEGGGLQTHGEMDLLPGAKGIARVSLRDLILGQTNMKVEARRREDGGWIASVNGAAFDARPLIKDKDKSKDKNKDKDKDKPKTPFELSVQLGKVVLGDKRVLAAVLGSLRHTGTEWDSIDLGARADGTATISLRYQPDGAVRRLSLRTDNAGTTLRALDLSDHIHGGTLAILGESPRTGPPTGRVLSGTIEMLDYTLVKAPVLARILNAISPLGLAELLGGEGITFSRLSGAYRWGDDGIVISGLRTAGAALGLTVEGRVDPDKQTADLHGTIVPVYALNSLLGNIPLLGTIVTGGEGQGILATNFSVSGKLDDPEISVNPLSMLTPGFLRNLFFPTGSPGELSKETGR